MGSRRLVRHLACSRGQYLARKSSWLREDDYGRLHPRFLSVASGHLLLAYNGGFSELGNPETEPPAAAGLSEVGNAPHKKEADTCYRSFNFPFFSFE